MGDSITTTSFYNAQHSPIGSFSSFTLGAKGAKGGLAIELGKPADQNIFIGLEDARGGTYSCLPFFDAAIDESKRFDVNAAGKSTSSVLRPFADNHIARQLTPGSDCWQAGDLTFTIHTPVCSAPDPEHSTIASQKLAYVPALAVEFTVDNRRGRRSRKFFLGYQGNDPYSCMRSLESTLGQKGAGIANGASTAIVTDCSGVYTSMAFTAEEALAENDSLNRSWGLGNVGLLIGTVPAGVKKTIRFVVCFHRSGIVTTGLKASYYYTQFFEDIESVANWALAHFKEVKSRGVAFDKKFVRSSLNPARRFMLAQAIHSYYGSTELLRCGRRPLWIVNEGEYRMINTFDLTADQVFFEMKLNPWTVANELDWFTRRYSYVDHARFPKQTQKHRGGLSFAHDMGMANHFTPSGRSVYEKAGLHGCFSHMTHEELVNWLMCALIYEKRTRNAGWLKRTLPTICSCLQSMLNRDHPDPIQRRGIMSLDSSRCNGGSEITTYDSLDVSLGQARHNLYLAVKCWGVYVGLAALYKRIGDTKRSRICEDQAKRCTESVAAEANPEGLLPAILFEKVDSRIIPAIEGLIIPYSLGLWQSLSTSGPYGAFIRVLKMHLERILHPGICLFPDGGWKLSSTSDNSWLSKIYLCQFVAEKILGIQTDYAAADGVHAQWLCDSRNLYWAWSDQMVTGEAKGSKYYPRGVTAILWLDL